MNVYDVIQAKVESYRTGVRYQQIAYEIFASNYQMNIETVNYRVLEALSMEFQNGNYPKRSIENLAEYWLLKIVINMFSNIGRPFTVDEKYAHDDMVYRYNELNANTINRNGITTQQYQGISPTSSVQSIFSSGNNVGQSPVEIKPLDPNLSSLESNEGLLALLKGKAKQEEVKEADDNQTSEAETNVEQPQPSSNQHTLSEVPKEVEPTSEDNTNELPTDWFTEVIGLPKVTPNNDENVKEATEVQPQQEHVEGEKEKHYAWKLSQYKSMTEEEIVEYREHELNMEELNRYNNIANYSESAIPIIKEQKEDEVPQPIIKTDDLYLTNKIIYLPQSSDIGGSDEYYNNIHAEGKGVITLLAEYGHNSGVYIGDEATRRTLTDFNSKIFTISNLDVLVNLIKASRGGRIMRNLLNCKLSEWVHDMIRMPLKQQTIPLILNGNFKEDLNSYLNHIELNRDMEDAYDLLMNHANSLSNYMPVFKSLCSLYLKGHHLPIMDVIPVDEYDKAIVGVNYTAMVRIPVDFKCLGLDAAECPNNHFIGKIDDYKQFFLLEQSVLNIIKTMDNDVSNIRLIIADSSGHVVNFKRVEEPIAIMKVEKR